MNHNSLGCEQPYITHMRPRCKNGSHPCTCSLSQVFNLSKGPQQVESCQHVHCTFVHVGHSGVWGELVNHKRSSIYVQCSLIISHIPFHPGIHKGTVYHTYKCTCTCTSSLSALTFIPPVTRAMVSLYQRQMPKTNICTLCTCTYIYNFS